MANTDSVGSRCVALVGPYLSGKTTLLEAMLAGTGAIKRKGSVKERNTIGDSSPIARKRQMSIELNMAHCQFMGENWSIIDCPGSVEFAQDGRNALMAVDIAVVVVECDATKARIVSPILKFLADNSIPHLIFINKIDNSLSTPEETMTALQEVTALPLVLRHVPIRNANKTTGYVDLISQRVYSYKSGEQSSVVEVLAELSNSQSAARQNLLESFADFNDELLEKLLDEIVPNEKDIYRQLVENLASDKLIPVMIGAGELQSGVFRLWKSLRHDTPHISKTALRRGFGSTDKLLLQVFKTTQAKSGKLSHARIWSGNLHDGIQLGSKRVGGLFKVFGAELLKIKEASAGDVVALGRLKDVKTGDVLSHNGSSETGKPWSTVLSPVYSLSLKAENHDDEVKLSSSLAKLVEEDPSCSIEHNPETHELLLHGQGEIHLSVSKEQIAEKYNVHVIMDLPNIPYKETISRQIEQHARHKKQSGGHGQFGDVQVEISPKPRGKGFEFSNRVVGGTVPKQYIPSVETGVRNYLKQGPLGFPVVDISVCLFDGQYHAVDSSDMAFQMAAQAAMREGLPKCRPILLEPICKVEIDTPSDLTSKVNQIVSGRRGQLLGFEPKENWNSWDMVNAYLPQAEISDLIIELRSLTQGIGSFRYIFDHFQELSGREAEIIISKRQKDLSS